MESMDSLSIEPSLLTLEELALDLGRIFFTALLLKVTFFDIFLLPEAIPSSLPSNELSLEDIAAPVELILLSTAPTAALTDFMEESMAAPLDSCWFMLLLHFSISVRNELVLFSTELSLISSDSSMLLRLDRLMWISAISMLTMLNDSMVFFWCSTSSCLKLIIYHSQIIKNDDYYLNVADFRRNARDSGFKCIVNQKTANAAHA